MSVFPAQWNSPCDDRNLSVFQLEEHRNTQKQMRVLQKKQSQLVQDKDNLRNEHSKAILARSKLESLCRELQRHNRTLKVRSPQRCDAAEQPAGTVTVSAGRGHTENPAGGGEEEGGDVSFPGDAERHPGSDGAAQREKRQPAAGERRAGREAQETLRAVQAEGRGKSWSCPAGFSLLSVREASFPTVSSPNQHIDKVVKHKDLQQQLVDAKLHQAQELLKESEERHEREKDFVRMFFTQTPQSAVHGVLGHKCYLVFPRTAAEGSHRVPEDV